MVLDRRGFVKFIAGASVGVMATPVPWKLLDDVSIWTQNWSWIPSLEPGENTFVHAVSKMCPSGSPLTIRRVGERTVRVLPFEEHPLGGGLTALNVAEVQMLFSPARVKRPLLRSPDGGFLEIEWEKARRILLEKLQQAGKNTAFISGDETGSINEVISAFAGSLGSKDVFLMPSDNQSATRAAGLMGLNGRLGYDLENSDYILAIGANILESWGTVVRNRRIYRDATPAPQKEAGASSAVFAYAGPLQHQTAAVAKPWLPIYPGTEGVLALGIANMLIARGRIANSYDFGAFKALAARYTPEETARLTGVDPTRLESLVNALSAAKAPLVIVGSEFNQGAGAAPVMAGFAVNALLGNINRPGGLTLLPETPKVLDKAMTKAELFQKDLTAWFASGKKPELLILHEANPVYSLPNSSALRAAIKGIPFRVSFSTFMDETASLCNLVLPIGMGLERVDDVDTPYGSGKNIYSAGRAVAKTAVDVHNTGDVLLGLAEEMGVGLGYTAYEEIVSAKAEKWGASLDAMANGEAAVSNERVSTFGYMLRPDILAKAFESQGPAANQLRLAPYVKLSLGTGKTGIPPYNNKLLRASELKGRDMSVMMNSATASRLGLADGDKVLLDSGRQTISASLRLSEGVMDNTVAVSLGYGHTALDDFSRDKGANVMDMLVATPEPETGLNVWSQTGVVVSKA